MKLCRLLLYDIRQGFAHTRFKLLGIAAIALVSCIDLYLRITSGSHMLGGKGMDGGYMDYLFFLLGGMKEYKQQEDLSFIFPIKWFLLNMYILYGALYYPYRDLLSSMGGALLMKSRSRRTWWLSKCLWSAFYIVTTYMFLFVVTAVFCALFQQPFSMQITPALVIDFMDTDTVLQAFSPLVSIYTLIMPLIISLGMCILQMMMSLVIKPVFSFGIAALIMLSSAYLLSPYLIGNYAMPFRSIYIMEHGVYLSHGLLMGGLLIGLSALLGWRIFGRYDILNLSEL